MASTFGPGDAAVRRRHEKPFSRLEVVVQLVVELFLTNSWRTARNVAVA